MRMCNRGRSGAEKMEVLSDSKASTATLERHKILSSKATVTVNNLSHPLGMSSKGISVSTYQCLGSCNYTVFSFPF